ncbi:MAG: hypothetical protein AAGE43_09790 [Pseudomonadota bacterium]
MRKSYWLIIGTLLLGGCVTQPPPEPPALSTSAREQIGYMAVRAPERPQVTLTEDLDGRGEAAGRTAWSAGAGWLGGSLEMASQSGDEGALLIALFGLATAPMVAAGGAVYGAAAADSAEAVQSGNAVLSASLDHAPSLLVHSFETALAEAAPVRWQAVGRELNNHELLARGFDSVLDLEFDQITSRVAENRMHVYFVTRYGMELTNLHSGIAIASRQWRETLPTQSVSSWAENNGAGLAMALDEDFDALAAETVAELFTRPAIRVRGLEPVSRGTFGVGSIPGRRPLFIWTALDGTSKAGKDAVRYELELRGRSATATFETAGTRFVPPELLLACERYRWRVRAHYQSFGSPATSAWTPEYRFKTACGE